MTYYVKGKALNGTVVWLVQADSVSEAIELWKEKTYVPKYVEEVREYNTTGKVLYSNGNYFY